VRTAMQAAMKKTGISKIETAIKAFSSDDIHEVRAKKVLNVLEQWRERVSSCEDTELRKRLLEKVASLKQYADRNDPAGMSPGLKELFQQWNAYQDVQINKAKEAVMGPYCKRFALNLRDQLKASGEALALLQPHPMTTGIEEELDRVRLRLQNIPRGAGCLEYITDLYKRLLDVGARLFTTIINIGDVPADGRLAAARDSGVETAITLANRLMTEPRPLYVTLRTPEDELYVGRKIILEIGNLHDAWGPGVKVLIDFGDGTPLLVENAEDIRQKTALTHRYRSPQRVVIRVLAAEDVYPGSL